MRIEASISLVVAVLALGVSCTGGGDGDSAAAVDPLCEEGFDPTWQTWGKGFFVTYCNSCHAADSPNRFGATEGVSFDTYSEAVQWAPRVRARVLESQDMPLGGGVKDEDLYLLDIFLTCGL
jgi:uncharacterized membrane protein